MVLLLKYDGENGGGLVEQRADLLFIVLSHDHVFQPPYPVSGKVQLYWTYSAPSAAK